MKRILMAALVAATLAPAAQAEQSVTLPAIGKVLATKTPDKYRYMFNVCERLYTEYMKTLDNNHIAANAQAGCAIAVIDSLGGKSLKYREAKARWSERENMSATEAGEDLAALMQGQFDLIYIGVWEATQTELANSK